jgi:hypothetical protein
LDGDIAVFTKYLRTENESKDVLQALETLSDEQHASWQAAVERIEQLMEKDWCLVDTIADQINNASRTPLNE